MKQHRKLIAVLAVIPTTITLYLLMAFIFGHPSPAEAQSPKMPDSETPKYTADGELIKFSPDVFREWIWVGEPVTPNELNPPEAAFPEFHDVYINPTAWREWKKTGTFPDGTVMIKELTSVGSKESPSGKGYNQGEFTGLEHSVKDSKRFQGEGKGWAYFTFGHKYPLKEHAPRQAFASCSQCHVANAKDDEVFTQYYPVLRAAKPMKSGVWPPGPKSEGKGVPPPGTKNK
jgi:hypothetical protein